MRPSEAGVAFIKQHPVFNRHDPAWARRFEKKGLPVIGDDVKSQLGATIIHRVLTHLFNLRGVKLERTYQLNTGGNTDFLNMLDRSRLKSKRISKTEAVQSQTESGSRRRYPPTAPAGLGGLRKTTKVLFPADGSEAFRGMCP